MIFSFSNTSYATMSTFFSSIANFILAIILPVQLYLLLIGGVILLDSYYGYHKAIFLKEKISWLKFFKGIRKKIAIYTPAMLGIYWLDFHLLNEFLLQFLSIDMVITKIGCTVLLSTEIASINQNIKTITGKSLYKRIKDTMGVAKDLKQDIDSFKE